MDNTKKTLLQIITHHRQNPLDFIYVHKIVLHKMLLHHKSIPYPFVGGEKLTESSASQKTYHLSCDVLDLITERFR
jgi:hypothetical protein